jgi:hypothetical protein
MFGVRDMMVPVDYFTVGERIGDGERIALNPEDGKLYSCYNGTIKPFYLEHELHRLIEECEEEIIETEEEKARAAMDPEEKIKKSQAIADKWIRFMEERSKKKSDE